MLRRPRAGPRVRSRTRTVPAPTSVAVLSDGFWRRHYGGSEDRRPDHHAGRPGVHGDRRDAGGASISRSARRSGLRSACERRGTAARGIHDFLGRRAPEGRPRPRGRPRRRWTRSRQRLAAQFPKDNRGWRCRRRPAAGATSSATFGPRCSFCSARWPSCCSSPARTSPICCSPADARAAEGDGAAHGARREPRSRAAPAPLRKPPARAGGRRGRAAARAAWGST